MKYQVVSIYHLIEGLFMFKSSKISKRVLFGFVSLLFVGLFYAYFVEKTQAFMASSSPVNWPDYLICDTDDGFFQLFLTPQEFPGEFGGPFLYEYGSVWPDSVTLIVFDEDGIFTGESNLQSPCDSENIVSLIASGNAGYYGSSGGSTGTTTGVLTLEEGIFDGFYLYFGFTLFAVTTFGIVSNFRRRKP